MHKSYDSNGHWTADYTQVSTKNSQAVKKMCAPKKPGCEMMKSKVAAKKWL